MSALDFLFQGQPPQSVTNYGNTVSQVPTWLQEYAQGILGQSAALASQPFQPYQGPTVSPFTQAQLQAQGTVQGLQGQYQPTINAASNLAQTSATPSALSAATGYVPQAAGYIQSAVAPTSAQMNPYTGNVIQKAEDTATQYWNQIIQPSIQQQYAAAGQSGSTADITAQSRAAQPIIQNIQDTANSALAQAYQNAQQTGLQAGQATGALGQVLGGLGYEGGVLGLQGASQLGSLGALGQTLGLQGAAALDTTGAEQQQLQQQNLNTAYSNFLQQQQYPYQQAGWLSQMLAGTPSQYISPNATTTAQTGYAPAYSASPLSQTIGLYNLLNPSGTPG